MLDDMNVFLAAERRLAGQQALVDGLRQAVATGKGPKVLVALGSAAELTIKRATAERLLTQVDLYGVDPLEWLNALAVTDGEEAEDGG